MTPTKVRYWFLAAIAVMLLTFGTANLEAGKKKAAPPPPHPHIPPLVQAPKPLNPADAPIPGAPLHALIAQLENTRMVLNGANHDYKGHRARALHHTTLAMRDLERHPHHRHEQGVPRLPYVKPVHENQAISDAQLVQARVQLFQIHQNLTALHNSHPKFYGHPHIHAAGQNMTHAVHQIGIALEVSPINTPPLTPSPGAPAPATPATAAKK